MVPLAISAIKDWGHGWCQGTVVQTCHQPDPWETLLDGGWVHPRMGGGTGGAIRRPLQADELIVGADHRCSFRIDWFSGPPPPTHGWANPDLPAQWQFGASQISNAQSVKVSRRHDLQR